MKRLSLRWQQVLPRVLVVVVAVVGVQHLLGLAARRVAVRSGEASWGANVEVANARVSLLNRQIRLENLRVANPRRPDEKLLEADNCELEIAVGPLLRKQAIIDCGRVTGLRFATVAGASANDDENSQAVATSKWLEGNADESAREWLAHLSRQFKQPWADQFESVQQAESVCARWPAECAALHERAAKLKRCAEDLQQSADAAESNRLRNGEFFSALPEKISAVQLEFDELDSAIEKYASSLEAERRTIVAARQRDEGQVRKELQFAPIDADSLSAYLLGEQLAKPLDELIGWLRWARQVVPAGSIASPTQKRGEDILFADCRPAPNFMIRALHIQGTTRIGGESIPVSGQLTDWTSNPSQHASPIRLRLTSNDSRRLELQATIDRTGAVARDELIVDCQGAALPELRLGRSDELELKLDPSVGTLSISLAVEDEKLTGDLQLVQKEADITTILHGGLSDVPLAASLQAPLDKVNSIVTRISLCGTLEKPACTLWSNLGPALAEAMDRAAQAAGDERAKAVLADARRHVDERLAYVERQLAEERSKLASGLNGATRQLETIVQRQTARERISAEQLGRRLPDASLFRLYVRSRFLTACGLSTIPHMPDLGVIFDVDGVLIDSYRAHFASWRALYGELGLEYNEQAFAADFGRTSRDILRRTLGDEITEERIHELDERKEAHFRDILREDFPAMDGAVELIDALSADGFLLAVGSSGPPDNIALALEKLGRAQRFNAIVTGRDVTRGKPDPQVFLTAAKRLDLPAKACAVVEDAVHGIEAAGRAGMTSIALTGTATLDELASADFVVESLRELSPKVIRRLIESRRG